MTTGYDTEFSDGPAIGQTISTLVDVESLTNGQYMALTGTDSLKTILGTLLQNIWPVGVTAATIRTAAANTTGTDFVAASPNFFVKLATDGTAALQYSSTGATWSQTSLVTPASFSPRSVYFTNRWIALGGAQGIAATTGDNPNSTWSAITHGGSNAGQGLNTHQLAYSSSLALSIILDAGGVYSLANAGSSTTSLTMPSSPTRNAVVWDGTYFVIGTSTAGLIQRSTTGASSSFADVYSSNIPAIQDMASDGNGTIVATSSSTPGYYYVSKDHGDTWSRYLIPAEIFTTLTASDAPTAGVAYSRVSYANGKFWLTSQSTHHAAVIQAANPAMVAVEPVGARGITHTAINIIAYKGGTYVATNGTGSVSNCISFTEDTTKFRRPGTFRSNAGGSFNGAMLNYTEYMRVR
jgi:hypothetical protein